MKKRIFVGIEVPDEIKTEIGKVQLWFQNLPVRWTPLSNLHITLVPPWYGENVDEVIQQLRKVKKPEPVKLHFSLIESAPFVPKRYIWTEADAPYNLQQFDSDLYTITGQTMKRGFQFRPHITMARFRPEEFKTFQIKDLYVEVNWTMEVNSFTLFESKLLTEGARYEVIERF
jgi:RNA 2',3'-cyclic 3'-phosphodiesterase